MSYYLVLIGTLDQPLYETYLTSTKSSSSTIISVPPSTSSSTAFSIFGAGGITSGGGGGGGTVGYGAKGGINSRHVMQLIAHSSLDVLEDVMWVQGGMYLKNIDKFHEWTVSCWLTPGGVKLILLHELKNDDGIKLFLQDTWESYVKTLMNPFHNLDSRIRSQTFDDRIKSSAKKHL